MTVVCQAQLGTEKKFITYSKILDGFHVVGSTMGRLLDNGCCGGPIPRPVAIITNDWTPSESPFVGPIEDEDIGGEIGRAHV